MWAFSYAQQGYLKMFHEAIRWPSNFASVRNANDGPRKSLENEYSQWKIHRKYCVTFLSLNELFTPSPIKLKKPFQRIKIGKNLSLWFRGYFPNFKDAEKMNVVGFMREAQCCTRTESNQHIMLDRFIYLGLDGSLQIIRLALGQGSHGIMSQTDVRCFPRFVWWPHVTA